MSQHLSEYSWYTKTTNAFKTMLCSCCQRVKVRVPFLRLVGAVTCTLMRIHSTFLTTYPPSLEYARPLRFSWGHFLLSSPGAAIERFTHYPDG